MKELKFLSIILFCLTISCNQSTKEKTSGRFEIKSDELNLIGKVITYAPSLDTLTSKVYGECDCCSGNYLFLNKTEFINIDYCESDNTYLKGKYEVKNGNVVLNFENILVEKNYNWEKETDTTGSIKTEYLYHTTKIKPFTKILKHIESQKNICFTTDEKEIPFASIDTELKIDELLKQIKEDGIWNKLEMK